MQEALVSYLTQWMERYLKNRDLLQRRIEMLTADNGRITVTSAGKIQIFLIRPVLGNATEFLPQFAETERCAVVTYQTQENLDQLVQDWDVYARFKRHFAIYFINPFSPTEKCWVLFPWSHNVISERASLKPGLLSIASSVDFATLAQIEQSVKGEAA